ncbi:MAG TPA: hypothetical protein VMW56_10365 [Candidatus Margulisiibacteriota bacterium]|nr:hypothetical protein [Candidatus Margulisiibacteriota bacterium]
MRLRNILSSVALAAATVVLVGTVRIARGQPADVPPDALTDARFYTGSVGNQGVFPGKLICLRCDLRPGDAAKAQCAKDGHRFALEISGDPTIHPLIPGDANALKQLNAAPHGAEVSVNGTLFPSLGVILVGGVTPNK